MDLLQSHTVTCPHCWERISIMVDLSEPAQSYVEDCAVCCKAIAISYRSHDGEIDELSADPAD
jgi:transcription elongation factor Elf1